MSITRLIAETTATFGMMYETDGGVAPILVSVKLNMSKKDYQITTKITSNDVATMGEYDSSGFSEAVSSCISAAISWGDARIEDMLNGQLELGFPSKPTYATGDDETFSIGERAQQY
jgi:hypothetical protein